MDVALPIASPEVTFAVEDAGVLEHAAVPTIAFALAVESPGDIRSLLLNVEIRIAATRRHYEAAEQERLMEVLGPTEQWDRSLRAMHWTSLTVNVLPFSGRTVVELPVTCTYDLEVTGAKYLNALEGGDIPLDFLFTGTVFYAGAGGRLQVAKIGWDSEAGYRLPVAVWREMLERHFPGSTWLRMRRETFDALWAYRARGTLLTWDAAVESLLRKADE
jgi:hypothetical protein